MQWFSGVNVHCGLRILPRQTEALESLACKIIRASFSQERLRYDAPSATVVLKGKDAARKRRLNDSSARWVGACLKIGQNGSDWKGLHC